VPFVRPVIVQVVNVVVQEALPGVAVAVYPVIAEPFEDADAVQDTTVCELAPLEAVTPVGADGVVYGVAGADAAEDDEVPAEFVAVTVKVYAVPFVRPVTVQESVAVVQVNEPGLEVTVYEEIVLPPVEVGAVQETNT
jgi:hypothetical protein